MVRWCRGGVVSNPYGHQYRAFVGPSQRNPEQSGVLLEAPCSKGSSILRYKLGISVFWNGPSPERQEVFWKHRLQAFFDCI